MFIHRWTGRAPLWKTLLLGAVVGSGLVGGGSLNPLASAAGNDEPSAMEVVQQVIDAYNRHDLEGFARRHSEEMVTVAPAAPPLRGLQTLRASLPQEWQAFPDAKIEVKRIVGDDRQVAVELVWTGTYRRDLEGLPPADGQTLRLSQMGVYTVRNGRVTSLRSYYNPEDLTRQLAAKRPKSPPPPPTLSGAPLPRRAPAPKAFTPKTRWTRKPVRAKTAVVRKPQAVRRAVRSAWKPRGTVRTGFARKRWGTYRAPVRRAQTPKPAVPGIALIKRL
ncbi:MAG: ester cyclase [Armatimonadetes bacterium]|nr:ester cyclase [Armatimonadota bacterium]